jgi:hypothetical protein
MLKFSGHTAQKKNNTEKLIREMFKLSALSYEILRSKTFNFRSRNSPTVIHAFHFTKSPEMIVVVKKKKRNGCFPEGELGVLAGQLTAASLQGGGHHSHLLKHFLLHYTPLFFLPVCCYQKMYDDAVACTS